jgi:hypothetical protein
VPCSEKIENKIQHNTRARKNNLAERDKERDWI